MCIPHASAKPFSASKREKKAPKKHVVFDKKRLEPDASFVDRRKAAAKEEEDGQFLDSVLDLFRSR